MKYWLALALIGLTLGLALSGGWWRANHPATGAVSEVHALGSMTGCDAAQAECVFGAAGQRVSLQLEPPVRSLTPFAVQAQIESAQPVEAVRVTFTMADMDMGFNQFRLVQRDAAWWGDAVLPVCTQGRSRWLATLSWHAEGQVYEVVFPFTSQ